MTAVRCRSCGAPAPDARDSCEFCGASIAYVATAGRLTLRDYDGKPKARVFFVSYTRPGLDPATRPLTFAWRQPVRSRWSFTWRYTVP